MEDLEHLAQRAAAGDAAALDALLAAIRPDVMRRCVRILPFTSDAEDACQEALLAVARGISTFAGRSRFTTWLYPVVANSAFATYRRMRRTVEHAGLDAAPEAADPCRVSVLAGTRLDVVDALERLREQQPHVVEAVVLRDLMGLDYAEIAERLEVPLGTVKSASVTAGPPSGRFWPLWPLCPRGWSLNPPPGTVVGMSEIPGPWWRRTTALLAALAVIALAVTGIVVVAVVRSDSRVPRIHPTAAPNAGGTPSARGSPSVGASSVGVTVAAVGDLVCDPKKVDEDGNGLGPRQCQEKSVSNLLVARRPAALLALGDTQYADGTMKAFRTTYAPTYGRLRAITYPVPGNHEYNTPNAAGYYGYFGARAGSPDRGYYSFDLGGWHLVALNSNCDDVSCAAGSAQERWLRADLAAHPTVCTLAYWHHPRWSHGDHGNNSEVAPLVQALYDGKADVMLAGHDHDYERFVPRSPDGEPDPKEGIREFVVGTGGRNLRSAHAGNGTEAIDANSFGALFLTLHPTGYSWRFTASNGSGFTDSGSTTCH